jgi:hypothetical protein
MLRQKIRETFAITKKDKTTTTRKHAHVKKASAITVMI